MPAILILSRKIESARLLTSFLNTNKQQNITCLYDAIEAKQYLAQNSVDIILLDIPFTLDHELSYALSLAKEHHAYLILLVKKSRYQYVRDIVEGHGIFTIQKPIIKDVLIQVLSFVQTVQVRERRLRQANKKLSDRINEIKFVDRAKCLLIENTYISEEKAHKYIEKQAMRQRKTRGQIAHQIIMNYQQDEKGENYE